MKTIWDTPSEVIIGKWKLSYRFFRKNSPQTVRFHLAFRRLFNYPSYLIFQAEIQELQDHLAFKSQITDEQRPQIPDYTGFESIMVITSVLANSSHSSFFLSG